MFKSKSHMNIGSFSHLMEQYLVHPPIQNPKSELGWIITIYEIFKLFRLSQGRSNSNLFHKIKRNIEKFNKMYKHSRHRSKYDPETAIAAFKSLIILSVKSLQPQGIVRSCLYMNKIVMYKKVNIYAQILHDHD